MLSSRFCQCRFFTQVRPHFGYSLDAHRGPAASRLWHAAEVPLQEAARRMRSLPCALAIAGLDPSGCAGLYADLRAFRAASVWGCGAVAVTTVQSTAGLRSSVPVATADVLAQVRELFSHQDVRAIKIGALGSVANVRGVARWLAGLRGKVPVVIDPVLRASRGKREATLLETSGIAALRDLTGTATVITPNAREAEELLHLRVRSLDDAEQAARAFIALGARAALVKGGHFAAPSKDEVVDVLAVGNRLIHLRAPRMKIAPHGTGCTLASLIAGKLATRARIDDAAIVASVRWAKRHLASQIARAVRVGDGQPVMP
jgi:hydroxymethylpyrimidine kinase/phosphomethylpyrimidine kinase